MIPGSCNKSYDDQKKLLETLSTKANVAYEVPLLLEAATSLLMYYVQIGTPLCSNKPSWTYTRCQERVSNYPDRPLVVGGYAPGDLNIISDEDDYENDGVGASRKFSGRA